MKTLLMGVAALALLASPTAFAKDVFGCVLIAGKRDCPNRTQRNLANTDNDATRGAEMKDAPEPPSEPEPGEGEDDEGEGENEGEE